VSSVLRSLAFYAAFYGASIPLAVLVALLGPFSDRALRRLPHWWCGVHNACVRHILDINIRVEGRRPPGQALYAIKHESYFDALELPNFVPHPAVFAKEELFRIPFWGHAAQRYGLVPVARQDGARALRSMLRAAKARLAEGRDLALFPEGTRVPHGERPPLRSGFAGIYKSVGLPVVPVAINSGLLYHRRWKRRGTITIRFGEIIPPGLPRAEAEARVHAAINALNSAPE
jgi:1-acyl-sn-glycerol-3-phosphate acyltransferase